MAVAGDTMVVGAPRRDIGGEDNQGAVYVFVKPEGDWVNATEDAKLTALDGDRGDGFGSSAAVAGDTVVVAARGARGPNLLSQGAAYVFLTPVSGWSGALTENAKLTASDGESLDEFD